MAGIFKLVALTENISERNQYHHESNLLSHLMQVTRLALRESVDADLVLAGMVHDIGKLVSCGGHEKDSVMMLKRERDYTWQHNITSEFPAISEKTIWLVENHMRVWTYLDGEMRQLKKCVELANNKWFPDLIQLARWDSMGRKENAKTKFDKAYLLDELNKRHEGKCQLQYTNIGIGED